MVRFRLADPDRPSQRLDMTTLYTLCRLRVRGELLEWVPDKRGNL